MITENLLDSRPFVQICPDDETVLGLRDGTRESLVVTLNFYRPKSRVAIDHRGKKSTPGQKIKIITSKHNFFKDWDLKKVEK
jgi:hypothetical protein